jgi:hypothetical protein
MAVQDPEYLDKLFVRDVAELERLGRKAARDDYTVLQMSAVIRRLFCDGQCLAQHASKRLEMPLIFLVPEPIAGNPAYDPKRTFHPLVLKYAPEISERTHPFGREGFFHAPGHSQNILLPDRPRRRTLRFVGGAANCRPGNSRRRPTDFQATLLTAQADFGVAHYLSQFRLTYRKIRTSPLPASGSYRETG